MVRFHCKVRIDAQRNRVSSHLVPNLSSCYLTHAVRSGEVASIAGRNSSIPHWTVQGETYYVDDLEMVVGWAREP